MCVCMYIYIYICIYIFIYLYVYIHIYISICMHIYSYLYAHTHTRMHFFTHRAFNLHIIMCIRTARIVYIWFPRYKRYAQPVSFIMFLKFRNKTN